MNYTPQNPQPFDAERVTCPACGAWAGDPCESPTGRTVQTHAARKRYAEAARIDATHGLTAARAFLPGYQSAAHRRPAECTP